MAQLNSLIVTGNSSFLNTIHGDIDGDAQTLDGKVITDTYSGTSTNAMSGIAVKSAIDALDGTVTGSPGASKTLTAFSQTDGKVTATFGDIAVTQVNGHTVETDVPSGAVFTDTWRPTTIYENSEASAGTMLNNERVDYKGGDNVELVHTQEQWTVGSTVHTKDVVTFNSPDTTYTLGTSGNNVTLTPSSGTVQSITTPYATNSKTTGGIVRAVLDNTQTTATSFIATAQGITELYDGLTIIMKNTKITSATNWVIDLNGLGGKAVYNSKTNSRITTAYALNTEYLFVFDYTNDYWVMQLAYYENNTNTIGEVAGSVVVDENGAIFDSAIALQTQLNPPKWSSITTTGGTGTSKQHTSLGFLPNGNIIYSTSAASAGETLGQNKAWWLGSNSIRYWTNCGTSTLPSTAIGKSIYIKCTMSNGLLYIADAPWWAVDLPTTNDGYYYYYVGNMYSRYQCTFAPNHPIYYHDGFGIREYVSNEALRCYEEKNGSIITIDTDRALPVSMSKFIIDIDSEDGCTEANILHTGKNLCGGKDLCDTIEAGVAASTIDETNGTISFSASTTALGPMATGIYKENTRYTFIFTIYKGSGTSSNLKINYSDGTSYAWGGFEVGAKTTLAYTTPAGKTVTGLTKYNSSGTTTLYYHESGIFEGVLAASDFVGYHGQIDTIDFNGNTVHSGILDVLEGKLIIMDSEPYVTIDVGSVLYETSSPDDTFNYIIDCGTAIIEYVKNTPITDYIETRLKAANEWTFIDETGFDVTGAAGIVPISNYTNYSELMVIVYITNISSTDCYKGSHIISLADGGTLPGPSAVECIFGGYNYSSSYMLNYALQCSTSGTTYNISWRSGWFTMKPNPSNNNLYNIKVYAR